MPRWQQLTDLVEAFQVELHGRYSVERFHALMRYSQTASARMRSLLVFTLTPLPCLLGIVLVDLLPLDPPYAGLESNRVFWLRAYIGVWVFTLSFVQQFHYTLPAIPMSQARIFGITAFVSTSGLGCSYLTAVVIGFPIPFMMVTCSPGWVVLLVLSLRWAWGPFIRQHPEILGDVKNCFNIFQVQMSLLVIYPAYSYVFTQLSATHQAAFSVVLQVIKLVSKNALSKFIGNAEDIQPEVVIFNAEVFHALFVAVCLQNSSSISTSLALLGVDFLVGCLSLHDVTKITRSLHELGDKIDLQQQQNQGGSSSVVATFHRHQIIQRVTHIIERNHFVKQGTVVRVKAFSALHSGKRLSRCARVSDAGMSSASPDEGKHSKQPLTMCELLRAKLTSKKIAPLSPSSSRGGGDSERVVSVRPKEPTTKQKTEQWLSTVPHPPVHTVKSTSSSSPSPHHQSVAHQSSSPPTSPRSPVERELEPAYVKQAMKLFHVTEFLILVEYTEVIIPMVYSVYLAAMSHLPNYVYYPQLARMEPHKLQGTILNVLFYACLELASFVLLHRALRRQVRFSLLTQLAFVLERQWHMVQSKLVLWVLYIVQSSLEHFGADYTFTFAWLSGK